MKAYLTYHLRATGYDRVLPPTWSSAFDDVPHLMGMPYYASFDS